MHITHALESLCPGAEWVQEGDAYEGLIWKDSNIAKPSKQQLEAELERLQIEKARTLYQRKRASEYPPMADFLDAWVKQDQQALESYRQQCLDVKTKYPKT